MNEPSELADKRKRILRGFSFYVALLMVVPLLLCGGVLTWFFARQAAAQAKLDERIAKYQEQGLPIDNGTLQEYYHLHTEDFDAVSWSILGQKLEAKEYSQAASQMPLYSAYGESNESTIPAPGEPWPDRGPVDEFLKKYDAEFQELMRLAKAEGSRGGKPLRFPIKFESYATLLPDTQRSRAMLRLMQLKHAVAVHDEDTALALECLDAARVIARNCIAQPFMISQLTVIAGDALVNEMLRVSIELNQIPPERLEAIAEQLPEFDHFRKRFEYGISGERAMMLPVFTDAHLAEGLSPVTKIGGNAIDAMYCLDTIDQFADVTNDNPVEFQKQVGELTRKFQNEHENASQLERFDRKLSYVVLPAYDGYAESIVRHLDLNRLARLAINLRIHRNKTGEWPTTIEELAQNGVDLALCTPVNDKSFGYSVTDKGEAIVWGINRSRESEIPDEPPETEGEEFEDNRRWVWRLKP